MSKDDQIKVLCDFINVAIPIGIILVLALLFIYSFKHKMVWVIVSSAISIIMIFIQMSVMLVCFNYIDAEFFSLSIIFFVVILGISCFFFGSQMQIYKIEKFVEKYHEDDILSKR